MKNKMLNYVLMIALLFTTILIPAEKVTANPIDDDPLNSKDWSVVVFTSYRDGNWEIYRSKCDGSSLMRLTATTAHENFPVINSAATQVVFEAVEGNRTKIYRVNIDGSGLTRLTTGEDNEYDAVWSPDGSKIAYVSEVDKKPVIFVMNADGSGKTQLTYDLYPTLSPAWLPDGNRLVYIRQDLFRAGQLVVINSDGSGAAPLRETFFQGYRRVRVGLDGRFSSEADINSDSRTEITIGTLDNPLALHAVSPPANSDARIGSFSPDGDYYIYTEIDKTSGASYIKIADIGPDTNYTNATVSIDGIDRAPYWVTTDFLPPLSGIHPLPQFSGDTQAWVTYWGYDLGGSGIKSIRLEWKRADAPTWSEIETSGHNPFLFRYAPGYTYYFRSRAIDNSRNTEAWPAVPDASTTIYSASIMGKLTDNRGYPLPHNPTTVNPAAMTGVTTDRDGAYKILLGFPGTYNLFFQRPGYSALDQISLTTKASQSVLFDTYLPPLTNLISNSGFESGLEGWKTRGELSAVISGEAFHSGNHSVQLGSDCEAACLNSVELSIGGESPNLVADLDGTIHLIYKPDPITLAYSALPPGGSWTPPVDIHTEANGDNIIDIEVTPDGVIHVFDQGGRYHQKKPGEDWKLAETFGFATRFAKMEADAFGNLHVIYMSSQDKLETMIMDPNGVWSQPEMLYWNAENSFSITAAPDGSMYYLMGRTNPYYDSVIQQRLPNGTRIILKELSMELPVTFVQHVKSDHLGGLHVFVNAETSSEPYRSAFHAYRSPNGEWGAWAQMPYAFYSIADVEVDKNNTLYIISDSQISGEQSHYMKRSVDGNWSEPIQLNLPVVEPLQKMALDPRGNLHAIQNSSWVWPPEEHMWYVSTMLAAADQNIVLEKTITIPENLHQPTLAGTYRFKTIEPNSESAFVLSVNDGLENHEILRKNSGGNWSLFWSDLSTWSGQTVTLNLSLDQASGESYAQVLLDSLSLGEWATPIISEVAPLKMVTGWRGNTITMNGINLSQITSVFVGGYPIQDFTLVDEHTILIKLPLNLPAGIHSVKVVDPSGCSWTAINILHLGYIHLLPLTSH